MNLRRYWFRFKGTDSGTPRPGCGVTTYSYEDALAILSATVFMEKPFPEIEGVIEDADISALDQKHVLPNMEAPAWRGVWYPRGFSQTRWGFAGSVTAAGGGMSKA